MKLRSHEILSTNKTPIRSSNPSRLKQLFQRKNLFKKKIHHHQQQQHGLVHTIPDYVRKSIFRFLLEVKSPSSSSTPPPSTPSRTLRHPPLMGIQALKNKKQHLHHQPKRSLRLKQQQPIIENNKPFEDYQQQQNNYDMTILHMNIDDIDNDDDDDIDSIFATKTSTNQKKQIPQWARKNELQIAICNQIYFHRNPSEIFGNSFDCSPAHLRTILHSMLPNVELLDESFHHQTTNNNSILLLSLAIFIISITSSPDILTRQHILSKTILFDDQWQFSFDQINWLNVTLPHTPRIESVEKTEQQWQGVCFYRKRLIIDDTLSYMSLRFDGAMHETDVWINDKHIGRHLGGYLPFYINLPINESRILNILVKLRNTDNSLIPPGKKLSELDFNYYGGLYRHVWLIKKSKQFYLDNFIRINYENVSKTQAILIVKFNIITNSNDLKNCHIRFLLNRYELYPFDLSNHNEAKFLILNPRLWSPLQPSLYHFTIELVDMNTKKIIYDQQTIKIGIRSFEFHSNSQYVFINGEKFDYIVGTNRHQEYPYIGYALSDSAQYRDAYKIKQAGFSLVRCSHYPPSTAFLDACDYLGILVINSIPGWQYFGNETFQKNSLSDIEKMMERDYNHPSILLWEASLNESPMNKEFMIQAHNIVKKIKPDSLTGGWIDDDKAYDIFMPARQHGKAPDFYKNYRAKNNKILFIAEYGDWEYYGSLEANFNQKNSSTTAFKYFEQTSRQLRKYGQKRLLTQAKNFQQAHNDNRRSSQTARTMGDANWLMFDYKRGYAPDIEASGIMDIFRLPKFAFYFYQSQCTTCTPMIFIANYWIDPFETTITVYSNCDSVELRLNNVLITDGEREKNENSTHLLRPPFIFKIDRYIPGRLEAIGFINKKSVVRTYRETPDEIHHHLAIEVDLSGKPLTSNDIVFVYAYIHDKNNIIIPDADDLVQFSLTNADGQAMLIGENPVHAEAGIATILLKTSSPVTSSKITITASSPTLQTQEAHVVVSIIQ